MRRLLMGCAAAVLITGVAAPAVAAAGEPRVEQCWTHSVPVPEETGNLWTYVHTVRWCGDGRSVTSVEVEGSYAKNSTHCKPDGDPVTDHGPHNGGESTFSMGTLLCEGVSTGPQQVCPWVIVVVYGDGRHDEPDQGIERSAA